MVDLFDAANYPAREPQWLVVGDRWAWKRADLSDTYPPASYTLKYSFRRSNSAEEVEITSTVADFVVEVPAATTAGYTSGHYAWQAYIVRNSDSERVTVGSGSAELLSNQDAAATDPRSHARKMVDLLEAALEGRATDQQIDVLTSAIGDRSVTRKPEQLKPLLDQYRAELAREEAAEAIKNGMGSPFRIYTRFA